MSSILNQIKNLIINKDISGLINLVGSNKLDKESGEIIFSFIYEYTNSFKNQNTSPEILELGAKLLDLGVEHYKLIVDKTKKDLNKMKFFGVIIAHISKNSTGQIIGSIINEKIFKQYDLNLSDLNNLIDELLFTIKNVEVVVFNIVNKNKIERIIKYKRGISEKFDDEIVDFEKLLNKNIRS